MLAADPASSSMWSMTATLCGMDAHIAAIDLDRRNHVTFSKTLSVNDWYHDGGDGVPLGTMQLIGKVQGVMMKIWATAESLLAS